MWSCEVSAWLWMLNRLVCVLLCIRSIIRLRCQIILKHCHLNIFIFISQWPNALSLYFIHHRITSFCFFSHHLSFLCSYSVLQMLKHHAWLWFWSLIKSCLSNFRSRFYFCIFHHINLFTLVSCGLFFLTCCKPPSFLSWLLPTSLPFFVFDSVWTCQFHNR